MRSYSNPYHVLGVPNTANDEEIRRAYKRLALAFHPDRHSGKSQAEIAEAEKKFKEINHAYETLNPDKKNHAYQDGYHAEDGDDSSIVIYKEADQLSYEPTLQLTDYDTHKLENLFKKWSSRHYSDNTSDDLFSKFKDHSLPSLSLFNSSSLHYNSNHLKDLDESTILKIIDAALQRYQNIPNQINEDAFLWVAKKKDCAPIYFYGTNHGAQCDFEDRFGDAFDNIMDKVDVVYTEIEEEKSNSDLHIKLQDIMTPRIKRLIEILYKSQTSQSIDNFIANKAAQHNKELRPLENQLVRNTALKSCNASTNMQEKVTKLIDKAYKELDNKSESEMQSLTQQYLTNNTSFETKIYTNDEIKDYYKTNYNIILQDDKCEIITAFLNKAAKRTLFWMKKVLSTSCEEKKSCLVAPGKAHITGPMGLPNLFAFEGYDVSPLMVKAPTSRKSIIRDMVFGQGPTLFKQPQQINKTNEDSDKQIVVFKSGK